MRGGMPDTGFAQQLQDGSFFGKNRKEDILAEAERYPLMTGLWEDKIPDFDRITVPAYIVASYSNTLHTAGTFRAWRRIASEEKWLRIHNGQEWPDYYDEANIEDLRRFFDRYLKGEDNGWEDGLPASVTPCTGPQGGDQVNVAAECVPAARRHVNEVLPRRQHPRPCNDGPASRPAEAPTPSTPTRMRCPSSPVSRGRQLMVGYPKAHLWVEARGADDMDLFVLIQKLDAYGTPLQAFTVPNHKPAWPMTSPTTAPRSCATRAQTGGSVCPPATSTNNSRPMMCPPTASTGSQKLSPKVKSSISRSICFPIGLAFHPGEQLRFVISSRNLLGTLMPGIREYTGANSGHTRHPHRRQARLLPSTAHQDRLINCK
jgi:predicted acyl esterase